MKLLRPLLFAALAAATPLAAEEHLFQEFEVPEGGFLTVDDLQTVRSRIYRTYDENGDRILVSAEYDGFDAGRRAEVERVYNGLIRRAERGLARDKTDQNHDGQVSSEEFRISFLSWFALQDKNGDGVLSRDEI